MSSLNTISSNPIPAHIDKLCDVVPNKKRSHEDFVSLLNYLENAPKECIPFRGKILQHVNLHALGNPNIDVKLTSLCFAKASILFKKTPNKNEGPLGAWKAGFSNQVQMLEKNLNELYQLAGLNVQNVVNFGIDKNDEDTIECDELKSQGKPSEAKNNYQSIIDEYLLRVNIAANNICALFSIKTDFELPLPVHILLKLASKIGSLRWSNYKKKPDTLIRSYVFSLSPYLIEISLMMYQSIVSILGSNIIPFVSFINFSILRMLEWTRTSNLEKSDEKLYHMARLRLFKSITFMLEQLSLNINYEPQLLKSLFEVELLEKLDGMNLGSNSFGGNSNELKNLHILAALSCLENLLIVYAKYLEAPLERRIKNYIIQACIGIYRGFSSNVVNLECRRQLLNLLVIIANQPYASSTTEIANHIFELVEKHELDSQMKFVSRKALRIGLSHRPTIVTPYEVYSSYNSPVLEINGSSELKQQEQQQQQQQQQDEEEIQSTQEDMQQLQQDHMQLQQEEQVQPLQEQPQPQQMQLETESAQVELDTQPEPDQVPEVEPEPEPESVQSQLQNGHVQSQKEQEDENELLSYMSHFVDKLNTTSI